MFWKLWNGVVLTVYVFRRSNCNFITYFRIASCSITSAYLGLQLRIFDIDTFDAQVLAGHREAIMSVDVSPDGKLIATASKDKTIRYAHPFSHTPVGLETQLQIRNPIRSTKVTVATRPNPVHGILVQVLFVNSIADVWL